jgi:hypothetical protein
MTEGCMRIATTEIKTAIERLLNKSSVRISSDFVYEDY